VAAQTPVPALSDPERLDSALAELEVMIRHRVDGLLQGNHLGLVPGPGSELGDARAYVPGDDVRRIDWSVTARTTTTHVRTTVADRELETWLAVDLSASMDFGTALCEKRDLAIVAVAVMAHLTRGGGNRIGAVAAGGGSLLRVPARFGRPAALHLLRSLASVPRTAAGARGDLAGALDQLRRPERRRGLVVAISDFLGPTDWQRPLRALTARHDIIAVQIGDPRDATLPPVGMVTLVDPESGRTKQVRVTRALADRFAAAAAAHQSEVDAALRRVGVPVLHLATDRDWVGDVVRFVVRRKRGWIGSYGPVPVPKAAAR
jgi:uncharacterized protein (DUF58 family)